MSGVRCLLTGGTGFLGRHVAPILSGLGYEVTILAPDRSPDYPTLIADIAQPEVSIHPGGFRLVCHMAGLAHTSCRDAATRSGFQQVNVDGTSRLLRALQESALPEAVVFISTVAVYGRETGELLDEETPRDAVEPYGASKRDAEDVVLRWCEAHNVRSAILRLPLVAGRRPPGNLGSMVQALRRGRYFGVGAGAARRSMVWADDVGRIIPAAAQAGGVYHLTDGRHPSFAELETALCAALRLRPPRRLPWLLASAGGHAGDAVGALLRRSMPLNSRTLRKLTSTLTFTDERARRELHWSPSPVLDHASEIAE